MELKGPTEYSFEHMCRVYEQLIGNLQLINQRVLLWIR